MPVKATKLHGWDALRIVVGDLSMTLVPDIGGRMLSLRFRDTELLFVQDAHKGECFDFEFSNEKEVRKTKRELGFRLWGGDKTWIAPQSEWLEAIPPLDLDAGRYRAEVLGNRVVMHSSVCRETGLRVTRAFEPTETGGIVLDQSIVNESDRPVRRGIWNVTQFLRPFDVLLPAAKADIRAYPEEGDSVRLHGELVTEADGWTRVPCREPLHFKYGGLVRRGVLLAWRPFQGGRLVHARRFPIDPDAPYRHGAMAEVYNSPDYDYLEVEVHAPARTLVPGELQTHRQIWDFRVFDSDAAPQDILAAFGG